LRGSFIVNAAANAGESALIAAFALQQYFLPKTRSLLLHERHEFREWGYAQQQKRWKDSKYPE
jgi:hypothetical protein